MVVSFFNPISNGVQRLTIFHPLGGDATFLPRQTRLTLICSAQISKAHDGVTTILKKAVLDWFVKSGSDFNLECDYAPLPPVTKRARSGKMVLNK